MPQLEISPCPTPSPPPLPPPPASPAGPATKKETHSPNNGVRPVRVCRDPDLEPAPRASKEGAGTSGLKADPHKEQRPAIEVLGPRPGSGGPAPVSDSRSSLTSDKLMSSNHRKDQVERKKKEVSQEAVATPRKEASKGAASNGREGGSAVADKDTGRCRQRKDSPNGSKK